MTDDMFEPRPTGWGLRGDPLLWDALEASLETLEPGDITDIEAHLRSLYTKLVGTPLTEDDTPVTVERFKMGGMSSGMISPKFWREEAIPLLVSRFPGGPVVAGDTLWWRQDTATFYALAEDAELPEGDARIWRLTGENRLVAAASLAPAELSREDAGRLIGKALLEAPAHGRERLRSLLAMVQPESGAARDVESMKAGMEEFLRGAGLMGRIQGLNEKIRETVQDTTASKKAAMVQTGLLASIGRLGEHMQVFGKRLKDIVAEDGEETELGVDTE